MGSQAFDTGLTVPQRTALRNAVVARLGALLKSSTPSHYLSAVVKIAKPVAGEHDEQGLSLVYSALQGQAPAMAVALGDMPFSATTSDGLGMRGELQIHVYVASANARGFDDGRLSPDNVSDADSHADPGIDAMLEHAAERLHGQDLGVTGVEDPRLTAEEHTLTAEDLSIWCATFHTRCERFINPDRAVTAVATSIATHITTTTDLADPPVDIVVTDTDLEAP